MSFNKNHSKPIDATIASKTTNDPPSIGKGKSSSLLRELTSSWSAEPVCVKYSLKDDHECMDSSLRKDHVPNGEKWQKAAHSSKSTPAANSIELVRRSLKIDNGGLSANDEHWKKKRAQVLRQCAEYLELESLNSKFTKDNFRRGFLKKVRYSCSCF